MTLPRDSSAFNGSDSVGNRNGPWDDVQGQVVQAALLGGGLLTTEVYRDTPFRMQFFRYDQNDTLHFSFQMPHTWDPTTSVRFHIHVVPMADPLVAQNVRFAGQYTWAAFGVETPANAGWTPFTADHIVSPGDVFKEAIVSCFVAEPPTYGLESSILLIHVYRDGLSASDSYTTDKVGATPEANLGLLAADTHFQKDKEGTSSEIPT